TVCPNCGASAATARTSSSERPRPCPNSSATSPARSLLGKLFPQFASRLIRNGATIGGNLGTGSPIGDAPPALLALEAKLVLTSVRGQRIVELNDYFTGYRQTVREADELITAIRIPQPLAPL